LCNEEESAYDRAFAAGQANSDKVRLLLREADTMLGMLSNAPPVLALKANIDEALRV
jgi:hypothetical protein